MEQENSLRYLLVSGKTLTELLAALNTTLEYSRVVYVEKQHDGYTALVDTYPTLVITPEDIFTRAALNDESITLSA